MSTKLTDEWKCPQCSELLLEEEVSEVRTMLQNGHAQVTMKCEHCGEDLTADTTEAEEGFVDINEDWAYS